MTPGAILHAGEDRTEDFDVGFEGLGLEEWALAFVAGLGLEDFHGDDVHEFDTVVVGAFGVGIEVHRAAARA